MGGFEGHVEIFLFKHMYFRLVQVECLMLDVTAAGGGDPRSAPCGFLLDDIQTCYQDL